MLKYIDDKLNDLKMESDEYKEYNELETQKSALEFLYYDYQIR